MKIFKYIMKILPKIGFVLLLSILWVNPALADRSPINCAGSSLGINLYTSLSEAHIGDTISYSVSIFNGPHIAGSIICDASSISASITTPDNIEHPITLLRTSLSDGQSDYYSNVVTYIIRGEDVTGGILRATASDSGVIHQNDTNSHGGGNQGVNVTIIIPIPITQDNGTTAGTFFPIPITQDNGTTAGTFIPTPITQDNGTTAGTFIPTPITQDNGTTAGTFIPTPITQDNGTTAGTFIPTPITQDNGTTAGTISIPPAQQPPTGGNNGGGGGGTSSPIIVPAVLGATISPLIVIPKLPKTGFPPREESVLRNALVLSGILILISVSFAQVLRKSKI